MKIAPQPGPQTHFLQTAADIALYGGAAGGGKSFGLLLEPLRHYNNRLFGGVIFRRNTTQIRNQGGLWDQSSQLYPYLKAHPREAMLEWVFPKGMAMKFAHLEHDRSVFDWQGTEIPYIGFDELTHFTEKQFWYMMSRNRSTSGVPGYMRATLNPDADSWVRQFIDWWIGEDGFPIPERDGKLRWFIRIEDKMVWADSREELIAKHGPEQLPKSVTFIRSRLTDNQILMKKDPAYLANLRALNRVERARLLDGNWNIRPSAGNFFQRAWFPVVDTIPSNAVRSIRFWDLAATKPSEENRDPDWTRGLKMFKLADGRYLVADVRGLRDTPGKVEEFVKNTASHDGRNTFVGLEQDPGAAGVASIANYVKLLQGYPIKVTKPLRDKPTRASGVSAQAEFGNVLVLRAPWNEEFFRELENFPDGAHDDQVDTLSGAFNALSEPASILDAV